MKRTPQDWGQELTKGFAGRLIRQKVEQVRKKLYLNRQDAEDLEQDLQLELWRRSRKYDATRGSWEAFTTEVTKRQIATKICKLTRQKRPVSIDASDADDSWVLALTKKDQVRHLGIDLQERDPDLACDIEFIKQQLDLDRQMLVDLLQIWNVTDASRYSGVARSTLVDRKNEMQEPFADLNPRDFKKTP